MKVYFVRHTKPHIETGICYGQSDVPVCTSAFEMQYKALSQYLPKQFSKVFSSPLQRCQVLVEKFSKNPIFDENLMELNFGAWEMKPWNSIEPTQMQAWMQDFVKNAPPQGENYEQLAKRTETFLQKLQNTEGNILVCTHAGVMRAVFAWIMGLPLANSFRLRLSYASCLLIDLDKNLRAEYSSVLALNNFEDFF